MSYVVGELFGHDLREEFHIGSDSDPKTGKARAYAAVLDDRRTRSLKHQHNAYCHYRDAICDGGGNRDMTRLQANDETVGVLFSKDVGRQTGGFLPCGVCAVRQIKQDQLWAICPHRLFAISSSGITSSHMWLARKIYRLAGFRSKDQIQAWSEIKLQEDSDFGATFNYRFDYILRPSKAPQTPIIIEVMTCSTSGGNQNKQTDMKSAFKKATLVANGIQPESIMPKSPGVNLRQVWARMASQLIAKSEAALAWGGTAIWIVQDALADYIRTQTALPLDQLRSPRWKPGEVNLIVSNLSGNAELYSGPIRPTDSSRACWLEILGVPHIPTTEFLMSKLDKIDPLARLTVP